MSRKYPRVQLITQPRKELHTDTKGASWAHSSGHASKIFLHVSSLCPPALSLCLSPGWGPARILYLLCPCTAGSQAICLPTTPLSCCPPRSSPTVLFLLLSQPLGFCTRCSFCLNTLHWAENNSLRPLSAVASFGKAAAAVPLPAPRPAEPPVFFSSHAPSTSPWPPLAQLTMSILNAFPPSAEPHLVKAMPLMFTTISPPPSPRLVHSDAQKRSVGRQCEGAFMSSCRRNSPRLLSSLGFPTTSKSWKTHVQAEPAEPWPALPAAPKPLASPEAGMAVPGWGRRTSLPKRRGWGCSWRGEAHSPRTARTGRTRRCQAGRRPAPRQVATAKERNSPRVLSSLGFPTTSKSWKTHGAGRAPQPWPALPAAPKPLASPEAGMAGPGGRRTTSLPKRRGCGCSWRGEAQNPRTARTGRTRRGQAGRRPAPRQVAKAEDWTTQAEALSAEI
ncbi:translation initiation factor IF-2-like isoform X4 [Homo sapiens]|uniref:translation initiation factor IF-2-like isoform X4 n=1 Tax=Homo sapiens TaxID=9606 RepID=UPI0023DEFE44|nr:translation initiation factor IF-2-like isoform X4 [Homo sapiens]